MRTYKLLKPLIGCPQGSIFTEGIGGDYFNTTSDEEYISGKLMAYRFSRENVETLPDWFELVENYSDNDLKLLANAFYKELDFLDGMEYGYIGVDCKRPFGNSFVEGDICAILGLKPEGEDGGWSISQLRYAKTLYKEKLVPYLKKKWSEVS